MTATTSGAFATEFKDQWELLEKYSHAGLEEMNAISRFLKEQARIEQVYADSTARLVKSFREEMKKNTAIGQHANFLKGVQSGTVHAGWNQLLNEAEAISLTHGSFSSNLLEQVRTPLKERIKENERSVKAVFDGIRGMAGDLKKAVDTMDKSKDTQERACRDMSAAYATFEKYNKDPKAKEEQKAKYKAEAEKKASHALVCVDTCNRIIGETNIHKNQFYETNLPKSLDTLQTLEESSRIEFMRSMLQRYAELLHAREDPLAQSVAALQRISGLVSGPFDTDCFTKLARTGESRTPADHVFGLSPGSSSGGGLRRRTSMERICASDGEKEDAEITATPLKSGRRKASDRVKQITRDLATLDARVGWYDRLVAAGERDGNSTSRGVVLAQRDAVCQLMQGLVARRARIESYLGVEPGTEYAASSRLSVSLSASAAPSVRYATSEMQASPSERYSTSEKYAPSMDSGAKYASPVPLQDSMGRRDQPPVRSSTSSISGRESLDVRGRAQAVFDFEAGAETDELRYVTAPGHIALTAYSMRTGDQFDILQKLDDGWWHVRSRQTGQIGLCPGNYMEDL